ncbi:papilin-like isoform X2 [Gigantopelta aegis]|uniref:papilin-like isoform X2 n=1 Tax=Gigantopelta aegis TaxID=1735272 RepID=UPI001B8876DA|nr:papilin-like isoform X2 [Gigantopelta aegis]
MDYLPLLLLLTATAEILCDDGRWDKWSDFTPCSRTCGGGVKSRRRGCIHTSPGVGNGCSGPSVKYASCNTQICPQTSDFRHEQCGEFNRTEVRMNGHHETHSWIPHFDEMNRCSLKCRAVGTSIVKELREKVVDGTQCDSPDGFGICVAGACQPVGCDRVIGSSTQEDKCRVCGGDGSACKSHSGHFRDHNLNVGYHEFLTIPQGATTIVVEQTTESINYFAVKTKGGHYHLNGGRDKTGQKEFAGTVFKYMNEKSNNESLESITARGPINETLVFVLATRDGKAGVRYEYSIPQTLLHKASPSDRYTWVHGRWTGCSRECGTGYQLRAISCIDRESGRSVSERLCPRREIPIRNQTCFNGPCAEDRTNGYSWVLGHWGECSVSCGDGEQTQLAYCQEKGTMGQTIYVSDDICVRYLHPKPQYKRVCEETSGCPHWATSPWSECNVTCGYGYQTRRVYCQQEADSPNDVPQVLSDRKCKNLNKPEDIKVCLLGQCPDGRNAKIHHSTHNEGRLLNLDCSATSYGCCPDGKTAAKGYHHKGCPSTETDRCSLEQSRGPCGNYTLKWYFDSQASTCNMFWYGSCGGNDNRFDTEEDCKDYCLRDNKEDNQIVSIECGTSDYGCCPDGQTSASGPNQEGCATTVVTSRSACLTARYGCCDDGSTFAQGPNKQGCPGSTATQTDCRYSMYGCCPGTTQAASGPDGQGCKSHSHTTAAAGGFDTASCSKEKAGGKCTEYSVQWYYNTKMGSCTQFWYGGCGGNDNRFPNKTDCEDACIHVKGPSICRLPMTSGPCRAAHPRFYFDYISAECRPFTYGGCHGNPNRFLTRKECETKCSDSTYIDSEDDDKPVLLGGCQSTRYGCCPDGVTGKVDAHDNCASGRTSCQTSPYGCCEDGETTASGPDYEGCDPVGSGDEPCHDSYYGCCPDGVTMATGPDGQGCHTEWTTTPAPVAGANEDVCRHDKSKGRCKDYVVQWFFDSTSQRCDRFWYGGCDDSGNHFKDEAACRERCLSVVQTTAPPTTPRPRTRVHVCDQPRVVGPCKAVRQRWYYDRRRRQCMSFLYGGCSGNDNNFMSQESCQRSCETAVATPAPTPAVATKSTTTMTGTDSVALGQTIQLKCVATPRGVQAAYDIEWFLNGKKIDPHKNTSKLKVVQRLAQGTRNQVAELTVYNANHDDAGTYYCRSMPFGIVDSSVVDVLKEPAPVTRAPAPVTRAPAPSKPASTDPSVICMETKKTGNCYALIPRWFYNHLEGKCQQFQYGGCGGNSNNFESQSQCEETCSAENVCKLPSVTGHCHGYFKRWHYDSHTEKCQEFVYGGCEGNPNNFETKSSCEGKCRSHTQTGSAVTGTAVCSLPRNGGNCNGYNIVWYYDLDLQRCRRFIYTGCGGNENRFDSDAECLQLCDGVSKDGMIVRPTSRPRVTSRPVPRATPRPTSRPTTAAPAPEADPCKMSSDNGRCASGSNYTIWWYYDSEKAYCTRFYYGGCGGNANRFKNREDCENECIHGKKEAKTTPYPRQHRPTTAAQTDCRYSSYGCCDDGYTSAIDKAHSNCFDDEPNVIAREDGDRTTLFVKQGRTVTLNCKLISNSLYSGITWYRDGFLLRSSNRFNILYNGSLTITHLTHRDSGSYACRVNGGNQVGQVQRFKVHVRVPLRILPSPETIIVKPGENAFLHCQVFGNPQPDVTWTKNGRKVLTNGRHHAFNNGTLIITTVKEHDVGDYECRADNGVSGSAKRTVKLVIKDTVTAKLDPYKGKVIEGGTIRLRCKGKGHPRPRLQWEKDGKVLENSDRVYLTHGELVIRSAVLDDSGVYTCVVSNQREEARAVTTVQVTMPQLSDKCENSLSEMNCKIILRAGLCGHRMFSKMCCISCRRHHG